MAKVVIAEKISNLLQRTPDDWGEADVVYFFVELRKLLDHIREERQQDLPHLRFYCDWVVHISKDRVDQLTLDVIKDMEGGISRQIYSPFMYLGKEAVDFAYFRSLKLEIVKLLAAEGIDTSPLDNEDAWVSLVSKLVKVLEEQPLKIKDSIGINTKSIIFEPSAPGCVIMRVDFKEPVVGRGGTAYPSYTLKNAF